MTASGLRHPTRENLAPPTREDLAPLLLRRFGLITVPILLGTAAFGALHIILGEKHLALLLSLKLLQAAATAVGFWFSTAVPTRRVIVGCLLVLATTVNISTAITGLIIGNVHTNALLLMATPLATASFLPWGPRAQAVSVLSAALAALAPLLSEQTVYHGLSYDLSALFVAFAISIYIAREVENDTLAEYRAAAAMRALAESRADFEAVFHSSNVLVALLDLTDDGFRYADVNAELAGLFGLAVETMRGKTVSEIGFSPEEALEWRRALLRCADEGSLQMPEYCLRLIRPERWYHIVFTAIPGEPGAPMRFSALAVDITERRQATQDAQRLNLDLEAQVRERTAMLEAANKDLESFAYSVSHDLRTPLRTIEGFATMLSDDHGHELPEEAVEKLRRISSASQHMAQLIDDMLMLSRASRGELRREPVDLSRVARAVVAELHGSRPEVAAEVEAGLIANADPQLVRIVMDNLIGNAWKYTGQRPNPHVHVGAEIHEGEYVFYVRDNGCGFDMRFVGKLFQPFQRLHTRPQFEGTGVGLATVARIVRRHGGKVWAEGEVDRGATFRFTLGDSAAVNPS